MKYNLDWLLSATDEKLKYLYFWGHRPSQNKEITSSCFSQWWDGHPFELEGIIYPTAEHYMMAAKAQLFGDHKIYEAILIAETAGKAKALGRQVKNFDFDVWVAHRCEIVTKGNFLKFSQHKELQTFLLNTNNRVLVEASPVDRVWGIGLVKDDPNARAPALWQGENLLGFCLMEVRDLLLDAI